MYFTVNLDRAKASRIESISDFPHLCDEKFIIDHLGTYVCYVKKTVCVCMYEHMRIHRNVCFIIYACVGYAVDTDACARV